MPRLLLSVFFTSGKLLFSIKNIYRILSFCFSKHFFFWHCICFVVYSQRLEQRHPSTSSLVKTTMQQYRSGQITAQSAPAYSASMPAMFGYFLRTATPTLIPARTAGQRPGSHGGMKSGNPAFLVYRPDATPHPPAHRPKVFFKSNLLLFF